MTVERSSFQEQEEITHISVICNNLIAFLDFSDIIKIPWNAKKGVFRFELSQRHGEKKTQRKKNDIAPCLRACYGCLDGLMLVTRHHIN